MRIFKKIKKWLLSGFQDELNKVEARAEYWNEQFTRVDALVQQRQGEIFQLKKELREKEEQIFELKDEIDIQRCKAAKYLSYYLEEMEKHAPND
jgi:predicted RNase H-like nuclease (RuvC/YqgF family)